jgi:two-component system, chemotaxis family, chemotaxis protein CheY
VTVKSILIVDDSEMARAAMCFSLKIKNYTIIDSASGKDAIKRLEGNPEIGLIITDLNMPEMNGIELIKHIRETMGNRSIPIFVLTTDDNAGKDVLGKGATGFLLKSSKTSEEVHKIIKQYIG